MYAVREDSHAFGADNDNNIFDNVDFGDFHSEFKVSDKGPRLYVEVIGELTDDVVISVPEEDHDSLLLSFPRDLQFYVHIFFICTLYMLARDRGEVDGIVVN